MRFIPALLTASVLALSACKDETANIDEIGKFTVEFNGENMEFISAIDKETGTSSIRTMTIEGIKLVLIDGSANQKDDQHDLPVISMSLQGGIGGGALSLSFVQVFDKSYDDVLTAEGQLGQKTLENLVIGDDGSISFDFSADLVRIKTQSEELIPDAAGAHIEGSFSGTIPASEREEN